MGTYIDIVNLSSGTTLDVYGSSGTITLSAAARRVIGLVNIGADPTYTTAEGSASLIRLSSNDLGYPNQVFVSGPYTTSGPGTNGSGQGMVQDIIPLDCEAKGNEVITIDVATTATITTARLHTVALIYADEFGVSSDWKQKFPNMVPSLGGDYRGSSQITTTRTGIGTAISVPSWVTEVIGVKAGVLKTGAITGGEEVMGYIELQSSIKGVSPQNFPTNALGATLGTPVGTGMYHDLIPWIPCSIRKERKPETLTAFINLRTTVTTANRCWVSVAWR